MVSEDWAACYKNRRLQLERQSRHWSPAKSRVLVRENEAGHIAVQYRGQRLGFRELAVASTALSEGRGAAPPPARTPFPQTKPPLSSGTRIIFGEKAPRTYAIQPFLRHGDQGAFLLWRMWEHF